ncbi:MAG: hypothetical protein ABI912_09145 [Actinomycetota bacterium]
MKRHLLTSLVAAIGATALSTSLAAAAPTPQALRTAVVTRFGDKVSVQVAVPTLLSGRPVPATAFTITDRGATVPVKVTQLPLAGSEFTVVADVPVADAAQLSTVQGALADFVYHLSPDIGLAIVPAGAGDTARPTLDRAAALAALQAIRPQDDSTMGPAVSRALADVGARLGVRSVVIIVSARSRHFGGQLADVRPGQPMVYALVTQAGGNSIATVAALKATGTAIQWSSPADLLAALDTVTADFIGQYRLDFETQRDSGTVQVATDYGGIHASAVVAIPAREATAAAQTVAPSAAPPAASQPKEVSKALGGTFGLAVKAIVGWFAVIGIVAVMRQRTDRRGGFSQRPSVDVERRLRQPQVIDLTDRERQQADLFDKP